MGKVVPFQYYPPVPCRSGPPQWPLVTLPLAIPDTVPGFPALLPSCPLGNRMQAIRRCIPDVPFSTPPSRSLCRYTSSLSPFICTGARRRNETGKASTWIRVSGRGLRDPFTRTAGADLGRVQPAEERHVKLSFAIPLVSPPGPGPGPAGKSQRDRLMQPRERLTRALVHATVATPIRTRKGAPERNGAGANRCLSSGRHFPSLPQSASVPRTDRPIWSRSRASSSPTRGRGGVQTEHSLPKAVDPCPPPNITRPPRPFPGSPSQTRL